MGAQQNNNNNTNAQTRQNWFQNQAQQNANTQNSNTNPNQQNLFQNWNQNQNVNQNQQQGQWRGNNQGGGAFAQMIQGFAQQAIQSHLESYQQRQQEIQTEIKQFNVSLDREQLQFFKNNGYLVLQNVVDINLINRALSSINSRLGKGMTEIEAAQGNVVRGGLGYWPDLSHTNIILDLVKKSPLLSYVECLIGKTHPIHSGQIALRFPGTGCVTKDQLPPAIQNVVSVADSFGMNVVKQQEDLNNPNGHLVPHPFSDFNDYLVPRKWKDFWHIDGVRNAKIPISIVPEGHVLQFSVLVGVLLKDLPNEFSGNLAVFPGSHLAIQDFVNQHGIDPSSLLSVSASDDTSPSTEVKLPNPPVQITGKAGDVVLCHWQTAHTYVFFF